MSLSLSKSFFIFGNGILEEYSEPDLANPRYYPNPDLSAFSMFHAQHSCEISVNDCGSRLQGKQHRSVPALLGASKWEADPHPRVHLLQAAGTAQAASDLCPACPLSCMQSLQGIQILTRARQL